MVLVTALSAALIYTFVHVLLYLQLSRRIAAIVLVANFVGGASLRLFATYAIRSIRRRLLVVGRVNACRAFAGRLGDGLLDTHAIIGYAGPDGEAGPAGPLARLGGMQDIVRLCRDLRLRDIVVCNGSAHSPDAIHWILPSLRMGCRVTNEATFYETSAGQILVDELTPDWFLFTDLRAHCAGFAVVKRVFDVVVSIVGLVLSLPLYPLLALAIKLEDGGPVFYAQDRVGKGGKVFRLYKFRTMRADAEQGESRWAVPNDPRTTNVGQLLRRMRFDEFPQFFNILKGDMAVVGPRPERPDLVERLCEYIPFWPERNLVKPGLTGWAQISFRYGSTLEDAKRKLQFDFYYLKHMSLELDTIILFRTLGTFLRGAC
jgi:exopolysaccharide biosynthesis polyprenyl glycosylphosphotransferase